jgi:oligoribonuclease NrnB/cAMP/cGMP phosphodiesterase (DHH superfamily)
MRIVTRPDFDGIVCAVLLYKALNIDADIKWVEPNEIQTGKASIKEGDILANLPYSNSCTLWFDHHISNKPEKDFEGAFDIAPSAAGVVYKYYQEKGSLDNHYDELVLNTDIIDSADLNQDQVKNPQDYPYIILSMTIKNNDYKDVAYWNLLVDLLKEKTIHEVLENPEVKIRCKKVIKENTDFKGHLLKHTKIQDKISITDFRSLEIVPSGNRFLTYCLFPETIASVKIRFLRPDKEQILLSIGKSIFHETFNVNIGKLLAQFGGGGHAGAGGCTLDPKTVEKDLEKILKVVFENQKEA